MHSFSTQWDFINTHFKVKAPILTLSSKIWFFQNILESKKSSSVQIEEVSYTESKQASQYQQKLKTQRNLQGDTENLT